MYRVLTILALSLVLGFSGVALAKSGYGHVKEHAGGFINAPSETVTVKEALNLPDDSPVSLRGKIEKRLKKDKYLFADQTGTITVEIDHDVWQGQTITPQDTVLISGETDKDKHDDKVKIEVDSLIKHTSTDK